MPLRGNRITETAAVAVVAAAHTVPANCSPPADRPTKLSPHPVSPPRGLSPELLEVDITDVFSFGSSPLTSLSSLNSHSHILDSSLLSSEPPLVSIRPHEHFGTLASPSSQTDRHTFAIEYDSDSDNEPFNMAYRSKPMELAKIEQKKPNNIPILHDGRIDPYVAREYANSVQAFCSLLKIPDEDQVEAVGWGLQHPAARVWYSANKQTHITLTLAAWLEEFNKAFLPSDWIKVAKRSLLSYKQRYDQSFLAYYNEINHMNSILIETPEHLTDSALRTLLEAGIRDSLNDACDRDLVHDIKDFKAWREAVMKTDEREQKTNSRIAHLEQQLRSLQMQPSRPAASTSRTTTQTTTVTKGSTFVRLPLLTVAERQLLKDNQGCLKCRRPFVNHQSQSCPNGFPPGQGYKPITAETIRAAQAARSRTRATAAILPDDPETEEPPEEPPQDATVAAVMPSAILYHDSEFSSDSDEYVAPLHAPHFFWPCKLLNDNVSALIDHGSHTVFIDASLVDRLQLPRRRLNQKLRIALAMGDSSPQLLSHWVKIRPSSIDSRWTSRSLKAVVSPSLAAPLILGQPFLAANKLVIDHDTRTCIPKGTTYDLFNPPAPPIAAPFTPVVSPKQKAVNTISAQLEHKKTCLSALVQTLSSRRETLDAQAESLFSSSSSSSLLAIRQRIEELASAELLQVLNRKMHKRFSSLFPNDIPHFSDMPDTVLHRFRLRDPDLQIKARTYSCPRPLREKWRTLLEQHLAAGRIRPSSSPVSSPAFLIPKKDPDALPRWVNDYRQLNTNTIPDNHPLPRIDDVLADCARGKYWAKIDMTNSFFQTKVHPDDIHLTAVTTPFGLYEWTVMPMGCRNAPATHQRRMFQALRPYIGTICHVYLDDIIIWSNTLADHVKNLITILTALQDHRLYCSPKKSDLFLTELDFLGHHISTRGLQASDDKIAKIRDWPTPACAGDVRSFLGIVRFIATYLPGLAQHTAVLTPLTTNEAQKSWPGFLPIHNTAFQAIKSLVLSRACLTTIDHSSLHQNTIFVTTDASDLGTGAVLSFGPTWATARPVAFDSLQLTKAERNYPVHEKELLAIVRALKKWRTDLLGSPFIIKTDHRTLESFNSQRDLSRRQARWQEFLAQYSFQIQYLPGDDNSAADALSRHPHFSLPPNPAIVAFCLSSTAFPPPPPPPSLLPPLLPVASILNITSDADLLRKIRAGYTKDPFSAKLLENPREREGVSVQDGLLFFSNRLVIPRTDNLRELFYRLAHDASGHFGADKSYATLRSAYYWPNMRRDLEDSYVKQCDECQRFKSSTTKRTGPLHPLPVPEARGDTVCMDFVGPLPEDSGFNYLLTISDSLNADLRLVPCRTTSDARLIAKLFFDHWYCENGLPLRLVSDRDKLFTSLFWRTLHTYTGVKLHMSTAFHPESDGVSERSNKTVIQALRYHVDRHQKGWVSALPRVRFDIMNSVNPSTGFSRFQLHLGRSPRLIPPLVSHPTTRSIPDLDAHHIIRQLELDVAEARDNLVLAKVSQRIQADKHRGPEHRYQVGDFVMLNTFHRRRNFMQAGDGRVAKFMPRWDGKFKILKAFPDTSVYELELPNTPNAYALFHASELKPYHHNDPDLFPDRHICDPQPDDPNNPEEYRIERIIDHRVQGRGFRYLVQWTDQARSEDRWLPGSAVADCAALDDYLRSLGLDPEIHSHPLR